MIEDIDNKHADNCPCKRLKYERHGECDACREHHAAIKGSPVACDRLQEKAERKAGRAKRRGKR